MSPGPGAYEDKFGETKKDSSKWRFGTGHRNSMVQGESARNPGPGHFEVQSTLSKNGASLKFRHDVKEKNNLFVPGPGN